MKPGTPVVRYFVTLQGAEYVVDLAENGQGFDVSLDGRKVTADLIELHASSLHSLLLDGHSREMVLERDGDVTFVSLDGERMEARVQDEVSRALSAIGGVESSGASEVTAPMPGVIVEILVSVGDEIEAGQPVVVMEAMKMQNELTAEAEGVVESVAVAAGDTVDGGDVLVVLAPKAAS